MIVGGGGKKRTPALAARHAKEFTSDFQSVDNTADADSVRANAWVGTPSEIVKKIGSTLR